MKSAVILSALGLVASAAAASGPTVYLIRHGEKPDDGNGLNADGLQRAQCLRSVFGASSGYNIGYIMAMTPKSGKFSCASPVDCFALTNRRLPAAPPRHGPAAGHRPRPNRRHLVRP